MSNKILVTADIHFGLSQKLNDILWAVNKIKSYALANNIDTIVVCGDFFHDRVNCNIEVLNAAYDFLSEAKNDGQNWIIFPGNHDMPFRNSWDINTLKPFNSVATIIDSIDTVIIKDRRFWILPFIHHESEYMDKLSEIETKYLDGDVLLTHIGVNSATLNECFLLKNWSVVDFKDTKFELVIAGHFHCYQNVSGVVYYPGSPIPFRFDEGMVDHGFLELDISNLDINFINIRSVDDSDEYCAPDFVTITDDMLDELDDFSQFKGDNIRIKFDEYCSQDKLLSLRSKLEEYGAKQVKFDIIKDKKVDVSSGDKNKLSIESPERLFNLWVDHDKPKKLDLDLLKKLNLEIVNE